MSIGLVTVDDVLDDPLSALFGLSVATMLSFLFASCSLTWALDFKLRDWVCAVKSVSSVAVCC